MAARPRCTEVWTEVLGNEPPPDEYLPAACCGSCHEDEEYGYWMCEPELPDGRTAVVCCAIAGRVSEVTP